MRERRALFWAGQDGEVGKSGACGKLFGSCGCSEHKVLRERACTGRPWFGGDDHVSICLICFGLGNMSLA